MTSMPLLALAALFLLAPLPAAAQDDYDTVKDSVYFTMDDNVMTRDEMEEEARYIHHLCTLDPYQQTMFNCDCVAGAFLIQREKLGPMTPQSGIFENVMNGPGSAACANVESVAGTAYQNCMGMTQAHRELAPDNVSYCTCVANKSARDFAKSPRLDLIYASSIEYNAMTWCNNPENRPARTAAAAGN